MSNDGVQDRVLISPARPSCRDTTENLPLLLRRLDESRLDRRDQPNHDTRKEDLHISTSMVTAPRQQTDLLRSDAGILQNRLLQIRERKPPPIMTPKDQHQLRQVHPKPHLRVVPPRIVNLDAFPRAGNRDATRIQLFRADRNEA